MKQDFTAAHFLRAAAGTVALPAMSRLARAEDFPSRPVTMVVPFAAGGGTDIFARILAEGMRGPLGQPVIIENVAGAGGSIGVGRVVHASPDGYTVSIGTLTTHVLSGALYPLQFDLHQRSGADRRAWLRAASDRREERAAGEEPQRHDRLAEGQSRQGDGGHSRRRLDRKSRRSVVSENHRDEFSVRAVSRRRPRGAGSRRRTDRHDDRAVVEFRGPGAGEDRQRARRDVEDPASRHARRADRGRSGAAGLLCARSGLDCGRRRTRRKIFWRSSMRQPSRRWPIRTCSKSSASSGNRCRRATSRRRTCSALCRNRKPTNGGRSSRPPISKADEKKALGREIVKLERRRLLQLGGAAVLYPLHPSHHLLSRARIPARPTGRRAS